MTEKERKNRYIFSFVLLALLLGLFGVLNLCMGSVRLSAQDVANALFYRADTPAGDILFRIRMPRLLSAMILGGALSVSGFLLQTFFHNPIAGPFVLGISSGAKLMVAIFMILSLRLGNALNSWTMIAAAFLGAMLAMAFVLAVASYSGRISVLIICGVLTGYFCSALTELFITFADDSDIVNLHGWSQGSFSGINGSNVRVFSIVILFSVSAVFLIAKPMEAFQLGEAYAVSSGVNVKRLRICLILLSGLLSATVAAFAGPVSFVGIAVPQLMRNLFKTEKPIIMIPASFMAGGVFCLFSDLISRVVFAPTELSISVVTSIFGTPVVIWMMLKKQKEVKAWD